MADTDLIENEIMFTRLCERPSDELRRAGVKLETNTLAYSGLFYVSIAIQQIIAHNYMSETTLNSPMGRQPQMPFLSHLVTLTQYGLLLSSNMP